MRSSSRRSSSPDNDIDNWNLNCSLHQHINRRINKSSSFRFFHSIDEPGCCLVLVLSVINNSSSLHEPCSRSTGTSEFTLTSASGESTATATSTATPNPPILTVEGNTLSNLGCFGSPSGHPGFNLTLTSALMTLELCAAACPTTIQYAGVVGTECYCGNVVDSTNEVNVAEGQCDTPCPGNPDQRCGHAVTPSGSRLKRQLLSVEIRLTIFARIVGGISSTSSGVSGTATISGSISGSSTAGVNASTVTATFTTTAVTTVGTAVVSGVQTITTTYCPLCQDCMGPFCYKPSPCVSGMCFGQPCIDGDCWKRFISYGGYCGYDSGCSGSQCQRRLVCYDGVWFPDVCDGYDCGRKIVCTNGQCEYATPGSKHYDEVVVCYGNNCEVQKCSGDACNQKYVCKDGSCGFQSGSASEAGQKYVWNGSTGSYTLDEGCKSNCPQPLAPVPVGPSPGPGGAPSQPTAGGAAQPGVTPVSPSVVTTATAGKLVAGFGALVMGVLVHAIIF
ncbi:hypothetical protein K4K61_002354 [Colletotrichum sp. SAR11_59]|nr:hypothetical protein K4K61_002354 [Colletotrichum sp. SAR11_59]